MTSKNCFAQCCSNVNFKDKLCIGDDNKCKNRPSFNYKGEKIGLYCLNHKLDAMININYDICLECNNIST